MGIVIDMVAYRTHQDVSLCILEDKTETVDDGYSTDHLYTIALQARKIVCYPSKKSGWKTSSAFNISQALKTGLYTLQRPEPGLIRLIVHETPRFYIDMYFRKSFYSSDNMHDMLDLLIEETIARKSLVMPSLLFSMGKELVFASYSSIDWSKVRMRPIDEDLPPKL